MEHLIPSSEVLKEQKHPEHRHKKIAGALTRTIAVAILAGCTVSPNTSAEKVPTPTQETISSIGNVPTLVEELPGFGNEVSQQERAMIRASTVKIAQRPIRDQSAEWIGNCTGTKVAIDGDTYVVTARHCFESLDVLGTFPSLNTGANGPDLHQTKDVTSDLGMSVGIWSVGIWTVENGKENRQHIAPVNNVRLRYYPDIALLRVDEAAPDAASFDAVPAIPYETALGQAPTPGSEVALYTLPESNDGSAVESTGWYLGRVTNPGDSAQLLDLVGINPSTPVEDGCKIGASGSMAIIAGGSMIGPLNIRNNILNPEGTDGVENPDADRKFREAMATQLGYDPSDLNDFTTICAYGVVTGDIADSLTQ